MKFRINVIVKLKNHVKDARGEAVSAVLKRIGLEDEANVRLGKFFELEIVADSKEEAIAKAKNIAEEVFTNPVVETFDITAIEEIL